MLHDRSVSRVDDVTERFGLTARTLQRLFQRYVGVSPKWVLRRYRLHEAAAALAREQHRPWAEVAADLGYFDQSHFIRDFTAAIGLTPGAYAQACRAQPGAGQRLSWVLLEAPDGGIRCPEQGPTGWAADPAERTPMMIDPTGRSTQPGVESALDVGELLCDQPVANGEDVDAADVPAVPRRTASARSPGRPRRSPPRC